MKALILDFTSRWMWVLLPGILFAGVSVLSGWPVILAPIGAVLLLIDAQRGSTRALRCRPIRGADHDLACWLVAVPLVPALSTVAMLPFTLLPGVFLTPQPHLWFRLCVQVWVSFGYAAASFILIAYLPSQPGETWKEKLSGSVAGALWGLTVAGFFLIYPNLPRSASQVATWHWVLFAGVPALFIASILLRRELRQRRSLPVVASTSDLFGAPWKPEKNALSGIPLFLATVPTRAAGITVMVYVFQLIFLSLFLREKGGSIGALASSGAIQTGIMGIMFASFTTMWVGIRSLRVLPISNRVLAALLISPALAVGILTSVFATFARMSEATRPLPVQPWGIGLLVFGVACIGVAMMIRYPKVGMFLLIALMSGITPFIYFVTMRAQNLAQVAPLLGAVMALTGYLLIARMLRRTSDVYRVPMFGMGSWSPQQQPR